jgi:hypothetical protein
LVVNRKNMGNMSKHISVLEFEAQWQALVLASLGMFGV